VIGEPDRTIDDALADAKERLDWLRSQYGTGDEDYRAFEPLVSFVEAMLKAAAQAKRQRHPLHSRHRGDPL
jgi:hypothetical protein